MLRKGGNPSTGLSPKDPQTTMAPYFGPNNWLMRPLSPTALTIRGTYTLGAIGQSLKRKSQTILLNFETTFTGEESSYSTYITGIPRKKC